MGKLWEERPGAKNRFDFFCFVQFLGKTSFCAGKSENTFLIGRLNVLARIQLTLWLLTIYTPLTNPSLESTVCWRQPAA